MTFSHEDLISYNEILADALLIIDDMEMKMFTPGWYSRQVHNGLKKLNYITMYIELKKDIPITENLIIPVPSGVMNIKDIFLWSGEECVISESSRVFHKADFISNGYNKGFTARHKQGQSDLFIKNFSSESYVKFYNINNGNIVLSDSCNGYDYIRIVYSGFPKDIGRDVKYIPEFCRDALTGYVVERAFFAMKGRDVAYRPLWADAKADLYQPLGTLEPSRWDMAVSMLKRLDKKHMDDIAEYLSRMFY